MHPNPSFRGVPEATSLELARQRGFGMLMVNGENGPMCSHIPFLLSLDGKSVEAHLARSNQIARALAVGSLPALLAVSGPDAYISPDWYGAENQVPTWNYVAIHLRGQLRLLEPAGLPAHLDRLSTYFEKRLTPKPPWYMKKLDDQVLDRLLRAIVPVHLLVTQVDATWKLAQNKDAAVRIAAAKELQSAKQDDGMPDIADLMRAPPDGIA